MSDTMTTRDISVDQLAALREQTNRVSSALEKRLEGYLKSIESLLQPSHILGRHVSGSRSDVRGSDAALRRLHEDYAKYAEALGIPPAMSDAINLDSRVVLQPFRYYVEIDGQRVEIECPSRWIVSYRASQPDRSLTGEKSGSARVDTAKQVLTGTLILRQLVATSDGLRTLLDDLRFRLGEETLDDFGALPWTTIVAAVGSFLPADDVIKTAIGISGVPAFVELVDIDASRAELKDPLRELLDAAR